MRRSKIIEDDRNTLSRLSRRLKPEERLAAYLRHSELLHHLHQAGLRYRTTRALSRKTRADA